MFHTGTANPRKKMTAAEMRSELIQRVQEGEIEEESVPKESTIANWITSFSRGWKHAMAIQAMEAAERTLKVGES
jgi:ribosome-binding factor A